MFTLFKKTHDEIAFLPIIVTDKEMVISLKFEHCSNVDGSIFEIGENIFIYIYALLL